MYPDYHIENNPGIWDHKEKTEYNKVILTKTKVYKHWENSKFCHNIVKYHEITHMISINYHYWNQWVPTNTHKVQEPPITFYNATKSTQETEKKIKTHTHVASRYTSNSGLTNNHNHY